MSYRNATTGAAVAGVVLVAMPVLAVAAGMGTPGPLHVILGALGALLVALSGKGI
jgi:hypothetical protein